MRCEVIAIGTELLLGQIVDSNSAWIGEQLALAGIDSHFQTRVGDNLERIVGAIRLALGRSEAVILCGGLGPTHDDITREAIAQVMDVPLRRDERLAERIRELFRARNRPMAENNLHQADVPEGATVIPQMPGTAPGLVCPVGAQVIYAVPGVPFEMRDMISGTVLPDLQRRAGLTAVIQSRTLRTWGLPESGLAELLAGRIAELDRLGNPTLAFLASGIEGIKVRITVKAPDAATAARQLAEEESHLRQRLGSLVFGVDGQTMETVVLDQLRERGLTLAVAEAITGGLLASRLTLTPGVANVLRGALVCGAEPIGCELLGVPAGPAVSEATVKTLATGACRLFGASVGLAAVGVTEANESPAYPPGTVFLGLARGDEVLAQRIRLPGRAEQIRNFTVISLLNFLRLRLLQDLPVAV
jgi:nicotinamide-nucleotide amidase